MKTSSERWPWRNALLTSNWWIGHCRGTTMLKTTWMVMGLITGLNVFRVIDSWALMKSLGYKTGFVIINSTIRKTFDVKDPFATNDIVIWFSESKIPSIIPKKSIHLITYSISPFGVLKSLFGCGGFKSGWWRIFCSSIGEFFERFKDIIFESCVHVVSVWGITMDLAHGF